LATKPIEKTIDEQIRERMALMRGAGVPAQHEALIPMLSPITGARFTGRFLASRSVSFKSDGTPIPNGPPRLVEMIDYERPAGWDVPEASGGRMPDTYSDANRDEKQFLKWVYQTFWLRDQNEVGGKPLNPQWRDPEAATGDKAAE
jgi:hypothetical protein